MSRVSSAMAWAELRGRDRGLRGSSSAWMAIWVLATGYRVLKRLTATEPVVVREILRPGEQLVVTHFDHGDEPDEPVRRRRRRKG